MEYYYNDEYGVIIYPHNWWDTLRNLLTKLLHPKFKRTWGMKPYRHSPHSVGCIQCELKKTKYPSEASC